MFCRLCGKVSFGNKCIYCGTSFDKTQRESLSDEQKSLPKKISIPTVQTKDASNQNNEKNNMAVAGFVMSMIGYTFLLGFIFSIIGLKRSSKIGTGKGFAIAGIIISSIYIISIIVNVIFIFKLYRFF